MSRWMGRAIPGTSEGPQAPGGRTSRWLGRITLGLLLLAWIVSQLSGYDVVADVNPSAGDLRPSGEHWLGTDTLGRDVFWRLLTGSEAFLLPGVASAVVAGSLGLLGGVMALRPVLGALARGVFAVVAGVPAFALVLLAAVIYGQTPIFPEPTQLWVLALAVGVVEAPALGEAVFGRLDGLSRAEFVLSARAQGIAPLRILWYHLLWVNCRGLVWRHLLRAFAALVVVETTLSYLGGYGVPEPTPSWGNMIAFALSGTVENRWAWLSPALVLWGALCGLGLLAGEAENGR